MAYAVPLAPTHCWKKLKCLAQVRGGDAKDSGCADYL